MQFSTIVSSSRVSRSWLQTLGSLLLVACAVSGCASNDGHPVTVSTIPLPSPVVSLETQSLTPEQVAQVEGTSDDSAYILGPNDVISVNIFQHPELSVPNPTLYGNAGGAVITSDGTVELPLIGNVMLGGLTVQQAQNRLESAYATYVVDPHVAIELQATQSLRYYLLGAFTSPGVKYPGHSMHLLDALALGGSVDIANADLFQAYVAQNSVKLPVDLHALLVNGDLNQNIPLTPGDAIVIPAASNENVFVFGSVSKPGSVSVHSGQLSILQALSEAGMDLNSMTNGLLSEVRVIRSTGAQGQFFVVNVSMIMQGKAAAFELQPGDIVFVPASAIGTWNEAINQLLPSLEAVAGILTPFVDIKYLRDSTNHP